MFIPARMSFLKPAKVHMFFCKYVAEYIFNLLTNFKNLGCAVANGV